MSKMKTAQLWDKVHQSNVYHSEYPSDNAQAFLRNHVRITEGAKRILDHGCGTGRHALLFNNAGLEVYAIDSSENALSQLRSKDAFNKINIQYSEYSNLPFDNDYFDYVFSEGVLYYGDEQSFISGLSEIYRCLKPNGVVRIYTKTDRDYWVTYGEALGNDTYRANNHAFENEMLIYCASHKKIIEHMERFTTMTIGFEEFNCVGLDSRKSFWVITATKRA